jgi:hypothetical protein
VGHGVGGSGSAGSGTARAFGGGPGIATRRIGSGRHSFARKPDAVRFLTLVQADLLRGTYVDPDPIPHGAVGLGRPVA